MKSRWLLLITKNVERFEQRVEYRNDADKIEYGFDLISIYTS